METQIPIFVVSSGRTGSTLLARMIRRHPRLLCVSDLFEPVGDVPYFDRTRRVDGETFFEILSAPSLEQRIAYWRSQPTAELLFLPEDDDQVSLLLSYTLPFLTDGRPMALYRELEKAVSGFPEDAMADQLIRFFDLLRDRFDKELWVERTGGSLPHMRKILETWPHARIVHNYRDTRETAISMMTGSFFKLYLALTRNPDLETWDWDSMPPVEDMGAMLNRWVVDGVAALEEFPDAQKMDLSYESLVEETVETLLRLSCFVFDRSEPTPEDVAWAEKEKRGIRRAPIRFHRLDVAEQQRLQAVCEPALEALGYLPAAAGRADQEQRPGHGERLVES